MGGWSSSLSSGLYGSESLSLNWERCQGNAWCPLTSVDLGHPHFVGFEGVYIVWRPSDRRAIRVGQGAIADRLRVHRADPEILAYGLNTTLLATWARVSATHRDGVERYLGDQLNPLVGGAFPNARPIAVNLPGAV